MIRIGLFCASGMSTSILISKMEKIAKSRGLEVSINAYPESEMATLLDQIDIALLGPQVRFFLDKAKKVCEPKGIVVDVINSRDYGMMDGEKILDAAFKALENK